MNEGLGELRVSQTLFYKHCGIWNVCKSRKTDEEDGSRESTCRKMSGIRESYSRQVHEKERNEDGRYTIRVTFFFLSLINLRKYYALHEIKCLLMFI